MQSPAINTPVDQNDTLEATSDGQSAEMDVSVIIVNYNVREFLIQSLISVYAASAHLRVEIFVVDNNSIDDSVEAVRTQFPDVILLCNKDNLGFATANNIAIRQARGRYVLVLNPDTILQEDTLDVLAGFMESHSDTGAVGCRILNPDGSFARESRRTFPAADVAFYRMIGLSRLFPGSKRFGRYNLTYLPIDQTSEVDALSGSCMMIRKSAFSTDAHGVGDGSGLFDESFFMYGEDLDLCYRIQQAGWKIFYVPDSQIIHYKGESTKKGELQYVRHFYGSMLLFIEKHRDPGRSRLISGVLRTGIRLRAGLSYLIHHMRRTGPMLLDFLIVYLTVTLLAMARSATVGRTLAPLFYASVSPSYAISTVIGIYLTGGYRRPADYRIRTALAGILLGGLVAASTSFFLPGIAFSRMVVALSLPVASVFLVAWRMHWKSMNKGPYAAILVGDDREAVRLKRMMDAHPDPPFRLSGYVGDQRLNNGASGESPPRLGRPRHLRDLVRLKNIREIVFAARCLSNQGIFDIMHELQDLEVQFRMLHEGSEHVIGKSRVSPVSLGSLLAQLPEVVELRPRGRRRWFEVPAALSGLALLPIVLLASWMKRDDRLHELSDRMKGLTRVLSGSLFLVGVCPEHISMIPSTWGLREGLFSITNTLNTQALDADELSRAYWYYVTHQSSSLDMDIIVRSFRTFSSNPRKTNG